MKNVVLCFGGKSFEHDISIITALIVLKKYKGKYNLLPVYLSKNNEWFYFAGKDMSIGLFKDFDLSFKKNKFKKVYFNDGHMCLKSAIKVNKLKIDACLNCCHGGLGEDGRLNGYFETNGISVSSGTSAALGICMDKILSKFVFNGLGVPVVDYFTFTKEEYNKDKNHLLEKAEEFGFPLIIKPSMLGSSIGIKVVHNLKEFEEGANVALEFDNKILVEKAILEDMKEYNIALMRKDNNVVCSLIDKVVKTDEILSFKDKYIGDGVPSKTGARKLRNTKGGSYSSEEKKWEKVPQKVKKEITKISTKVYEELSLKGIVRFDFILDKNNKVFLNEVNTVPGSLAYYFFVPHVMKNMSEFIDYIINETFIFDKNSQVIKKEYITNIIQ